ncbi:MAG: protein translocase subunit SecF [Deltaproteobacteria bacterium]|nr:protein translocase subunit SecF [Deltaproteobacteria bacterium]
MELIKHNPNIDFIKYRKVAVFGSLAVNLFVLILLAVRGLNMGVDFAGGSELEAHFTRPVSASDVRKAVESAGFKEPQVQEYGAAEEHAFLIRIGKVSIVTPEQASQVEAAVKSALGTDLADYRFDPDQGDKFEVRTKGGTDTKTAPDEKALRAAIEGKGVGVMGVTVKPEPNGQGFNVEITTRGVASKLETAFSQLNGTGTATANPNDEIIRRIDYVGPQVGKELRNRGIMAVVYAMVSILLYVFFRFDFRFAPGGVVALIHDVVVVLGYYVVSHREFNLIAVSVLLTIVGYSINDTIVVYDRIRENMQKLRGKDFPTIINISINETLSRTILTSGATALSLVGLLFFSVGSIWDFAMAMMVGIITGTYSSIYIASPVTIWLEEQFGRHGHLSGSSGNQKTAAA